MPKNTERWKPHVTVATIIEQDNRFLLVHEAPEGKAVYNQPAGHLDEDETLSQAAIRETLEETGWEVSVSHYLGCYLLKTSTGITYMRHGFIATPIKHHTDMVLDDGIIEAVWMDYDEIVANQEHMRSPFVKTMVDDYLNGQHYPLAVLHEDDAYNILPQNKDSI